MRLRSFLAAATRAFWRAGSGRRWELDAVAASDPSADRRDGFTAVFGCRPYVGHQRWERPEPQVIGAPPAHLVEQSGIYSGPDHRRRPQRVLGLVVLGRRVGPVFGKVALADAFELEGLLPARTALVDGLGGQPQQDLTGERVVLRVQRRESCGDLAELQTAGDARQRHPDRLGPVLGRGSLLLRHQPRPYLGLGDTPSGR